MSESERRRKYRYDRVMIETSRILTPEFDDAVVFLSGAQVEMLRNMTQYLRRLDTYVTEYNPGYYLAPTVGDYDSILAIVADLEETLMGNPNTIWGYDEQQSYAMGETKSGDGTYNGWTAALDPGEVFVLQAVYMYNDTGARGRAYFEVHDGMNGYKLVESPGLAQSELLTWSGNIVVADGGSLHARMLTCLNGDVIKVGAWGYKMVVPS